MGLGSKVQMHEELRAANLRRVRKQDRGRDAPLTRELGSASAIRDTFLRRE